MRSSSLHTLDLLSGLHAYSCPLCRTPANVTATTGSGTARTGADTPHPDPTGGALSSGVDTMIVMQYTPRGVNGVSYKVCKAEGKVAEGAYK